MWDIREKVHLVLLFLFCSPTFPVPLPRRWGWLSKAHPCYAPDTSPGRGGATCKRQTARTWGQFEVSQFKARDRLRGAGADTGGAGGAGGEKTQNCSGKTNDAWIFSPFEDVRASTKASASARTLARGGRDLPALPLWEWFRGTSG